ncbi:MAG: hypothetical protein JOZ42_17080 [Acetobacteraceae bacterium]|nr:hypothetical protein [Acetobacteraceae bacterium]
MTPGVPFSGKRHPRVWFTGNLRLGCSDKLRRANRSFASVDEMDHFLIVHWNEVVHPDDHVWVLGDFCADRATLADAYLEQLNGSKCLIVGDYDLLEIRRAKGWEYVDWFVKILLDEQWIFLSHYPLHGRPPGTNDVLNLFAHDDENAPARAPCCDVGLERWSYRPIGIEDVRFRLESTRRRLFPHSRPSRFDH